MANIPVLNLSQPQVNKVSLAELQQDLATEYEGKGYNVEELTERFFRKYPDFKKKVVEFSSQAVQQAIPSPTAPFQKPIQTFQNLKLNQPPLQSNITEVDEDGDLLPPQESPESLPQDAEGNTVVEGGAGSPPLIIRPNRDFAPTEIPEQGADLISIPMIHIPTDDIEGKGAREARLEKEVKDRAKQDAFNEQVAQEDKKKKKGFTPTPDWLKEWMAQPLKSKIGTDAEGYQELDSPAYTPLGEKKQQAETDRPMERKEESDIGYKLRQDMIKPNVEKISNYIQQDIDESDSTEEMKADVQEVVNRYKSGEIDKEVASKEVSELQLGRSMKEQELPSTIAYTLQHPTASMVKTVDDIVEHSVGTKRYGDRIKKKRFTIKPSRSDEYGAETSPRDLGITLHHDADLDATEENVLHEIQHQIQLLQGWASGGSPSLFSGKDEHGKPIKVKKYRDIGKKLLKSSLVDANKHATKFYKDLVDLSNTIRSKHSSSEDREDAIIRFQSLNAQRRGVDEIINKKAKEITPYQSYRMMYGEQESRETTDRSKMTQDQMRESPSPLVGAHKRAILPPTFGTSLRSIFTHGKDKDEIWDEIKDSSYFKKPADGIKAKEGFRRMQVHKPSSIDMMSVKNEPIKTPIDYLYHVTRTGDVPKIKEKGLVPFQKSNWVKAGDKKRYGGGEIFTFDNQTDALKWASNMDWAFNKDMGTGKISIVRLKKSGDWAVDIADPLSQSGAKGKWLKKLGSVDSKDIDKSIPVTNDMIKQLTGLNPEIKDLFKEVAEYTTPVQKEQQEIEATPGFRQMEKEGQEPIWE